MQRLHARIPLGTRLPALAAASILSVSASTANAQSSQIPELSRTQSLSNAQQDAVQDWMDEHLQTAIRGEADAAGESAQALIEPFMNVEVTAAFRFAAQDALASRLEGALSADADPLPRLTALRLCARIGTSAVLPELEEAARSDDPVERAFAFAAYRDFFETADEEASPIRQQKLDETLSMLRSALAEERQPAIAMELAGTLGNAGAAESDLRFRAVRAMIEGVTRLLERGVTGDRFTQWAVLISRAVESANRTYLEQQLGGGSVDGDFRYVVGRLCAHALSYSVDAARAAITGADGNGRELLIDMVRRANSTFSLVDEGDGGVDDLHEILRSALERGTLATYTDAVGKIIGPGGDAADERYGFTPVEL